MNRAYDVIVVGGGVIGCAVAYELAKRSIRTLLVDKAIPGRATSASAGGLWPVGEAVGLGCGVIHHAAQATNDSSVSDTSTGPELLPDVFRRFLSLSNARFPELSGELLELSGIDIEYASGPGLLFVICDERDRSFVDHVARSQPLDVQLERLAPHETARLEPQLTADLQGAVLLSGEYQVNPMLLAEAYKRASIRLGATFRHDTRVTGLRRHSDRIVGVQVDEEWLQCETVVNAAGAWAGSLAATAGMELPVFPVRGQIVLTETLPHTLHACLSTSVCYLAQKAHGEILIGSTTERVGFDVSVTHDAIRSLCRGAIRAVPMFRHVGVRRVWAGLRPGTPDELPILGPVEGLDGYVNATGGFRTGIVAAPLTSLVVAQLVCGEVPSYRTDAFSMSRFGVGEL